MSGHEAFERLDRTYQGLVSQETRTTMIAWVNGYVLALEDAIADIKQAQADGAETIEAALEEVQVTLASAVKTQAVLGMEMDLTKREAS